MIHSYSLTCSLAAITCYAVTMSPRSNYPLPRRSPRRDHCYPWNEWFDGAVWELTPGEDFTGTAGSFRSYLYKMADSFSYRLRTSIRDGHLYIQAYAWDGSPLDPNT